MGTNNVVFLEVIEWFDHTGKDMLHRIPEQGSGEIKFGAQLTVRESQAAVLFYQGKAVAAFGPGRHTLQTANIPILTKLLSFPWGFASPLRAEVCFVNTKVFANLKWGTRDPVAFRDASLGLIRLRAHGVVTCGSSSLCSSSTVWWAPWDGSRRKMWKSTSAVSSCRV